MTGEDATHVSGCWEIAHVMCVSRRGVLEEEW